MLRIESLQPLLCTPLVLGCASFYYKYLVVATVKTQSCLRCSLANILDLFITSLFPCVFLVWLLKPHLLAFFDRATTVIVVLVNVTRQVITHIVIT